jgi:hypothetical protein
LHVHNSPGFFLQRVLWLLNRCPSLEFSRFIPIISFGDNLSLAQIECIASQERARMMQTKVTTVIVNATKQGLMMKVGNRNCYAKLTNVKVGGKYECRSCELDQEFVLQDKHDVENQVLINSNDCCDYERITIKEINGKFDVQRDLYKQFRTPSAVSASLYQQLEGVVPQIHVGIWQTCNS